ncbi:hypothetical protein ACWGLF_29185 [Streptomyces puniciscabiei]
MIRDGAQLRVGGGPFAYGETKRGLDGQHGGERRAEVRGSECRVQFSSATTL